MIGGIFHQGSGLGNQLFRYVATRVLAEDKGYEHTMLGGPFKGSFMNIEYKKLKAGVDSKEFYSSYWHPEHEFNEKKVVENGVDIRGYDPEFNFIEDNTVIDGEFQDERYFKHRLDNIREWLAVEPLNLSENLCVIGFRGGEYTLFPDLFLPKSYWEAAIEIKRRQEPNIAFQVHTDDPITAREFFPDFEIIHDIGLNWRSVRYANHLIIANSSFYILPALLNETKNDIIAPRYWARHNTKTWALPQNYYSRFTYL